MFFLGVLLLGTLFPARADIYNWQTGEVIPGTEDIEPGPGVRLWDWNTEDRNLHYADFAGLDLSNARFESHCEITHLWGDDCINWSNLLDYADFSGANLHGVFFGAAEGTSYCAISLPFNWRFNPASLMEVNLAGENPHQCNFSGSPFDRCQSDGCGGYRSQL